VWLCGSIRAFVLCVVLCGEACRQALVGPKHIVDEYTDCAKWLVLMLKQVVHIGTTVGLGSLASR
jgi:hypothetical protein